MINNLPENKTIPTKFTKTNSQLQFHSDFTSTQRHNQFQSIHQLGQERPQLMDSSPMRYQDVSRSVSPMEKYKDVDFQNQINDHIKLNDILQATQFVQEAMLLDFKEQYNLQLLDINQIKPSYVGSQQIQSQQYNKKDSIYSSQKNDNQKVNQDSFNNQQSQQIKNQYHNDNYSSSQKPTFQHLFNENQPKKQKDFIYTQEQKNKYNREENFTSNEKQDDILSKSYSVKDFQSQSISQNIPQIMQNDIILQTNLLNLQSPQQLQQIISKNLLENQNILDKISNGKKLKITITHKNVNENSNIYYQNRVPQQQTNQQIQQPKINKSKSRERILSKGSNASSKIIKNSSYAIKQWDNKEIEKQIYKTETTPRNNKNNTSKNKKQIYLPSPQPLPQHPIQENKQYINRQTFGNVAEPIRNITPRKQTKPSQSPISKSPKLYQRNFNTNNQSTTNLTYKHQQIKKDFNEFPQKIKLDISHLHDQEKQEKHEKQEKKKTMIVNFSGLEEFLNS